MIHLLIDLIFQWAIGRDMRTTLCAIDRINQTIFYKLKNINGKKPF